MTDVTDVHASFRHQAFKSEIISAATQRKKNVRLARLIDTRKSRDANTANSKGVVKAFDMVNEAVYKMTGHEDVLVIF